MIFVSVWLYLAAADEKLDLGAMQSSSSATSSPARLAAPSTIAVVTGMFAKGLRVSSDSSIRSMLMNRKTPQRGSFIICEGFVSTKFFVSSSSHQSIRHSASARRSRPPRGRKAAHRWLHRLLPRSIPVCTFVCKSTITVMVSRK